MFYDPAKREVFYRAVLKPKLLRWVALKYSFHRPYVTSHDRVTAPAKHHQLSSTATPIRDLVTEILRAELSPSADVSTGYQRYWKTHWLTGAEIPEDNTDAALYSKEPMWQRSKSCRNYKILHEKCFWINECNFIHNFEENWYLFCFQDPYLHIFILVLSPGW